MVRRPSVYTLAGLIGYLCVASWCIEDVIGGANTLLMKKTRLDLVPRAGHARSFFAFSSQSQAERISTLREMSQRENARLAFLKAKLGMPTDNDPFMVQRSSSLRAPLYSGLIVGSGNYIFKVGLGTPAHELEMMIDTGSELAWTQCLPCRACYGQRSAIFDPTASSSYSQVPCGSDQFAELGRLASAGSCSGTTGCEYNITYLDRSFTTGDFAVDALTVGGEVVKDAYPFGCGHVNEGLFSGSDGLLGLSRSSLAFTAQTSAVFGGVFAYCMPPLFSSTAGYIEFGRGAAGGGGGSTPLVAVGESLYVVELESVGVKGGSNSKPAQGDGLVVVDSGTVITRLDRVLYTEVRDAFKQATSANPGVTEAPDSAGMGFFEACYSTSANDNIALLFPSVTFTFMGGLAFTQPAQNVVLQVDNKGTYCLALRPLDSSSGVSILGNYQQQGYVFTFDIASSTLSISSGTAC